MLQGNAEAGFLRPGAMIGEIETLPNERVDVGRPTLAGPFAGMQQHVLDDGVGALAVLHDLFEIFVQQMRQLADFLSLSVVEGNRFEGIAQFIDQFLGE